MSGRILVLGATGHVGRPLVRLLVAAGADVAAASRSGASVEGALGVRFDFADEGSIASALDGVDRVFVLAPTGTTDAVGTLGPVVRAATARGAKIVLMSALGVNASDEIPYRQVELAIERSGVPFVILRPNWFADNFQTFWRAGLDHGVIAVPAGEGRTSFIDRRDIAESAAAALLSSKFDGRAFDLTGPDALGYADAAAILSEVIGRPVVYRAIDDDAFVAILVGVGVAEDYARLLASIFHPVREGWTAITTDGVETLTGHAPRTLLTYARDNAAALGA